MEYKAIGVLDFGGQYAHLITAKLRGVNIFAELVDSRTPAADLERYSGLILSGSPSLASRQEGADYDAAIFDLSIPILGLCFGHQEIAKHYGGEVVNAGREFGPATLHKIHTSRLFSGLEDRQTVWMSHADTVTKLPPGFVELAMTVTRDGTKQRNAAIGSTRWKRYGMQFHPEVDDTVGGERMLENFAKQICAIPATWNMHDYLERVLRYIRKKTEGRDVLLLVSGGVDSTVCAWLLSRAVGADHLHLLHIDNGLMRQGESTKVVQWLTDFKVSHHIHFVDASKDFLEGLAGVFEPEEKRRIIGDTFISVLETEARKLNLDRFVMAQGTIYPDTIETGGSRRADVIKTHHNRVPVVQEMIDQGKMIEPLAELYKVEVRRLGEQLDIPWQALIRHPFPGPGLGVRCLASRGQKPVGHTPVLARQVRERGAQLGFEAALLPILSVGVKADLRSYEQPVLLWAERFDWEQTCQATVDLVNEINGINRCVRLFAPHMVDRVFPIHAEVTRARLEVLRRADRIVFETLKKHALLEEIWQCPVVAVPVAVSESKTELIVVRPVYSQRAMTAGPARLSEAIMTELSERIGALDTVWGVALDVTAKPPGTIEWE
jgi:GMP synthase (glutamine-hydrolysing)